MTPTAKGACLASSLQEAEAQKPQAGTKADKKHAKAALAALESQRTGHTWRLARELEELTGLGYSYRIWWIIPISPSNATCTCFQVD